MHTFDYIFGAIVTTISLVVFGWIFVDSYLEWLKARQRAAELLLSVLTREQYRQLKRRGYVDIPSPRDPERFYRVPRYSGLVGVISQGRRIANLCLQPVEGLPNDDIVVKHKLLIEADEETYLQTANRFTPKCVEDW